MNVAWKYLIQAVSEVYPTVYLLNLTENTYRFLSADAFPGELAEGRGTADDLMAQYMERVHPDYGALFQRTFSVEHLKKAFERGKSELHLDALYRSDSGSYHWVRFQAHMFEKSQNAVQGIIYLKDIDEKKQSEDQFRRTSVEAMQLMKAVSNTYDMVIFVNLSQNTYYMIEYEKFLNHTADELGNFDDLIAAGATTIPEAYRSQFVGAFSRESLLKAYGAGKQTVYLEHQQTGDDGIIHWVSTQVMFTENPYNSDILEITLSRCIDEIREKEEQNKQILRDALRLAEQANDAKTDFLSRMSHDIRTPMNAIIGMAAIAAVNLDDKGKVQDCLNKINSSSRYLLNLINDILDLSRIESGRMTITQSAFDFQEMIKSLTTISHVQAQTKNQTLTVSVSEGIDRTYIGDELRLKQILMNLLGNAHKYTPEGGRISLTITAKHVMADVTMMEFSVADNGTGITPEFQAKLFDAFSQDVNASGETGSGLGLAISQNLVHLMNGDITVESEWGQGSCFTVEIPLKNVKEQFRRNEEELPEHLKILVVDDDAGIREYTSMLLDKMGFSADTAASGTAAVEQVREGLAGGAPYDVAIVDWKMPGVDGVETVRQMRRLAGSDMMVVIMSAYDWIEIEEEARKAGIDLFLSKPIFPGNLKAILSSAKVRGRREKIEEMFSGERILLAEDNELNQEIAVEILGMRNLLVDVAGDGQKAVELFTASPPGTYSAILMDIQMPVMNGYEAARTIRASAHPDAARIPIYAMTANVFSADVREAGLSGMDGHIAKPVDFDKLFQILKKTK